MSNNITIVEHENLNHYPKNIISQLGIYGYQDLEPLLLAALASREPVLLIGGHGSGKTMLVEKLADALDLGFHAYDASKAMFEDIIGFPNPQTLASGQVSYVSTPLSLWDKEFVLIDELSRANPATQNKWLEIVLSKRLMGVPLKELKYIFAAMNPPSYLGAYPLDEALAGRFPWIITVPAAADLSLEDRLKVMMSETGSSICKIQRDLIQSEISAIRERVCGFTQDQRNMAAGYVHRIWGILHDNEVAVDGRRISMMYRCVLNLLAVLEADMSETSTDCLDSLEKIQDFLPCILPFAAVGEDNQQIMLLAAHSQAIQDLRQNDRPLSSISGSAWNDLQMFRARVEGFSEEERRIAVTRFVAKTFDSRRDRQLSGLFELEALVGDICLRGMALPPDDQFRILDRFQGILEPGSKEGEIAPGYLLEIRKERPDMDMEEEDWLQSLACAAGLLGEEIVINTKELARLCRNIRSARKQEATGITNQGRSA